MTSDVFSRRLVEAARMCDRQVQPVAKLAPEDRSIRPGDRHAYVAMIATRPAASDELVTAHPSDDHQDPEISNSKAGTSSPANGLKSDEPTTTIIVAVLTPLSRRLSWSPVTRAA